VRRLLPIAAQKMVGPWIFFDHMGLAAFKAGEGVDVRPHPHINLATVTYLFDGEILHRDSLGGEQLIRPGDINLMVEGSGIVHSEREKPETHQQPHGLPEADEETDPAFLHLIFLRRRLTVCRCDSSHPPCMSRPGCSRIQTLQIQHAKQRTGHVSIFG